MPLDATVESLDEVPEGVRDHYTETDDGYRLDVEGVEFEDEVQGLKSALQKERDKRKKYESRLSEIPDDWQDRLEEWENLKEKEKEREREKAEKEGEWEKLREQLQEQHREEIQAREEKLQQVESQLEQKIVDEALAKAASEHEAHAHLLPDYAKRFVRIEEKNGRKVPVVVDEDGDRRINNDGDDMTINELVASMREEERFKPLFKPTGSTGGGASGGDGAGGPVTKNVTEMSDQEKMDFIDEHGYDEYQDRLREAYSS